MRRISEDTKSFFDNLSEKIDENAVKTLRAEKFITQNRRYRLITPLFGGGSETKKADAVKIVRETEIRGQLRFWWRAIRGTGSLEEMRKKEGAIFGTAGADTNPSEVRVFVKNIEEGEPNAPFYMKDNKNSRADDGWGILAYAAFPLQPTKEEVNKGTHLPMKEVRLRVGFTLEISFPNNKRKDVEAALWAWETFGGIGARTRRGFGALELIELTENDVSRDVGKPISNEFEAFFNAKISEFTDDLAGKAYQKDTPHILPNSMMKIKKFENSQDACEFLIEKLRKFRQARKTKTDKNGNAKQSISYWSEPDAIRRIIKTSDGKTEDFAHPPNSDFENLQKFARGKFGFPIVFHFTVSQENKDKGEPVDTELRPNGKTRLASPLILKPVACSDGKAVALAFIMETPKDIFDDIHLFNQKTKKDYGRVEIHLEKGEEKLIKPMETLGETDVLKAFLKFLEK